MGALFVRPASITVPAGRPVLLAVTNTGALAHDLKMDGRTGTGMLAPGGCRGGDGGTRSAAAQAWCTVLGHREVGMVLAIEVEGAPAGGAGGAGGVAAGGRRRALREAGGGRYGHGVGSDVHDDLHATVVVRLREARQRYTAGRRALVEALAEAGRPMTIAELLERQPRAVQSSAYRNLAVLEAAGVVCRIQAADEFSRFELAEDLTRHHHHLLCVGCGRVADYVMPERLERAVRVAMADVTEGTGFRPQAHRVDLLGLCARCA
jgi:Fe2+ or Zn2+ uptake regulation protein